MFPKGTLAEIGGITLKEPLKEFGRILGLLSSYEKVYVVTYKAAVKYQDGIFCGALPG